MVERDPIRVLEELTIDSMPVALGRKKGQGRRRENKRVLKVSGTSPYLEYLPNMLKKVENYKHIVKDNKDK